MRVVCLLLLNLFSCFLHCSEVNPVRVKRPFSSVIDVLATNIIIRQRHALNQCCIGAVEVSNDERRGYDVLLSERDNSIVSKDVLRLLGGVFDNCFHDLPFHNDFVRSDSSTCKYRWIRWCKAECAVILNKVGLTRCQARLSIINSAHDLNRCCLSVGVRSVAEADEVFGG